MKDPFWIVVCDHRDGLGETGAMRPAERPHRHVSEQSAVQEAIRLTRACRRHTFYVFKVVVGVRPPADVAFESFKGETDFDDEIPF